MVANSRSSLGNINNWNYEDTDQICWYTKSPFGTKYQLLINKRELAGLVHLNHSKDFVEYSNKMVDIYQNFEE